MALPSRCAKWESDVRKKTLSLANTFVIKLSGLHTTPSFGGPWKKGTSASTRSHGRVQRWGPDESPITLWMRPAISSALRQAPSIHKTFAPHSNSITLPLQVRNLGLGRLSNFIAQAHTAHKWQRRVLYSCLPSSKAQAPDHCPRFPPSTGAPAGNTPGEGKATRRCPLLQNPRVRRKNHELILQPGLDGSGPCGDSVTSFLKEICSLCCVMRRSPHLDRKQQIFSLYFTN